MLNIKILNTFFLYFIFKNIEKYEVQVLFKESTQFHLSLSFLTERFNLSSYLFVERVGAKLHWTGDDSLGRDGVEDRPRLKDYQPGDVSHDLTFLELLQVQDLKENQSQMKLSSFNHPLK